MTQPNQSEATQIKDLKRQIAKLERKAKKAKLNKQLMIEIFDILNDIDDAKGILPPEVECDEYLAATIRQAYRQAIDNTKIDMRDL